MIHHHILALVAFTSLAVAQSTGDPQACPGVVPTHIGADLKARDGREIWIAYDLRGAETESVAHRAARERAALAQLELAGFELGVETPVVAERFSVGESARLTAVPCLDAQLLVWTSEARCPHVGQYVKMQEGAPRVLVVGLQGSAPSEAGWQPWLRLDNETQAQYLAALARALSRSVNQPARQAEPQPPADGPGSKGDPAIEILVVTHIPQLAPILYSLDPRRALDDVRDILRNPGKELFGRGSKPDRLLHDCEEFLESAAKDVFFGSGSSVDRLARNTEKILEDTAAVIVRAPDVVIREVAKPIKKLGRKLGL